MDGLPSTSVKIAFTPDQVNGASGSRPRAHRLRIFATNETRIVDESARLGECQVMALRLIQLLPMIILMALALVPSGAHLAALLLIGLFVEARPDLYPKSRNGEDRGRDRPRLRLPRLQ
jgi:hypothetical protein